MGKFSVVVPTIGRSSLDRAVRSALNQEGASVAEVIVVADTAKPLSISPDPRVKLIRVGPGAGGNVARQVGIEAAAGEYVALLDDDDVWMPRKLQLQGAMVDAYEAVSAGLWVASSRVIDTDGAVRPADLARHDTDAASYLFAKRKFKGGVGKLHTSTIVFPRALGLKVPFRQDLRFHQDVDWFLRVSAMTPRVPVLQCAEALVVCGETPQSVGKSISWVQSFDWALGAFGSRKRILGDFLLTVTFRYALRQGGVPAALKCFGAACHVSSPGLFAAVASFGQIVRHVFHGAIARRLGDR